MDFGLSEEQELLQETVRSFIENECPATRLRELFDAEAGHHADLWQGLAEMGLLGLAIPEEHGGAGLEVLDLALVAEVMGEGALPVPMISHALAGLAVAWGGSDEQQARWLPALASGDAIATVAFGEDEDRWQPEEWQLAEKGGALTGEKRFVPHGAHARLVVVGTAGGGLALVERGAAGIAVEPVDGVDRTRRIDTVRFQDTPCEPLARGAEVAGRVRDAALALLAADAFGAAWKLIRLTVAYDTERKQFDTPIVQFQAVKHQLANCALEIEPTRGLYWYAAHAVDRIPEDAARAAAVAKAHITDRAMDVARESVELHGGIGFTWECDVHMWFKRVMFDRSFLGTPERHRERVAQLAGW